MNQRGLRRGYSLGCAVVQNYMALKRVILAKLKLFKKLQGHINKRLGGGGHCSFRWRREFALLRREELQEDWNPATRTNVLRSGKPPSI